MKKQVILCIMLFSFLLGILFIRPSPAPVQKYVVLTFDDSRPGRWYYDGTTGEWKPDRAAAIMAEPEFNYPGVVNQLDYPYLNGPYDKYNMTFWQDLLSKGWEFGSHTRTHPPNINYMSWNALAYELDQTWLESMFPGIDVISFSYPFGRGWQNETVHDALRSAGYFYARASQNEISGY